MTQASLITVTLMAELTELWIQYCEDCAPYRLYANWSSAAFSTDVLYCQNSVYRP